MVQLIVSTFAVPASCAFLSKNMPPSRASPGSLPECALAWCRHQGSCKSGGSAPAFARNPSLDWYLSSLPGSRLHGCRSKRRPCGKQSSGWSSPEHQNMPKPQIPTEMYFCLVKLGETTQHYETSCWTVHPKRGTYVYTKRRLFKEVFRGAQITGQKKAI